MCWKSTTPGCTLLPPGAPYLPDLVPGALPQHTWPVAVAGVEALALALKVGAVGGLARGGEGPGAQPAGIQPSLFLAGTGGGEAVTSVHPTGPGSTFALGCCFVPPCGQEGAGPGLGQASSKAKAKAAISPARLGEGVRALGIPGEQEEWVQPP